MNNEEEKEVYVFCTHPDDDLSASMIRVISQALIVPQQKLKCVDVDYLCWLWLVNTSMQQGHSVLAFVLGRMLTELL